MKELKEISGLEFKITETGLEYKKEDYEPAIDWEKTLEAGAYAYKNPVSELSTLYFGARYMEKTVDEAVFVDNDFMGDLTILNSGFVGEEFVKTVGHYHGLIPGSKLSYPEVYEAVTDGIEYLLQSEPDEDGAVSVIWVITNAGDKVVMPPNWGHVSMNVGNEPAIEVDLQKRDNPNQSDYSMFKEKNGGALIRTKEGLKENEKYKIKSLRIVKPLEKPEFGFSFDQPLYTSFVEAPEKFEWLLHPEKYEFNLDELFEDIEL